MLALSEIANVYRPCFSVLNTLPLCFSEMVKPGPTVPTRRGGAIDDAEAVARSRDRPGSDECADELHGGTTPAPALPVC